MLLIPLTKNQQNQEVQKEWLLKQLQAPSGAADFKSIRDPQETIDSRA